MKRTPQQQQQRIYDCVQSIRQLFQMDRLSNYGYHIKSEERVKIIQEQAEKFGINSECLLKIMCVI